MHCCWRAATRQSLKIKKKKNIYTFRNLIPKAMTKSLWNLIPKGCFLYGFLFVFEIKKSNFFGKNTTVADVVPCCYEQTTASTGSQECRQHPVSPFGCDEIADQLLRATFLFDLQKSRVYPGIFCALRKTWQKNKSSRICYPYF